MTSKLQADMIVQNHVPRFIVRAGPPRAAMLLQVEHLASDASLRDGCFQRDGFAITAQPAPAPHLMRRHYPLLRPAGPLTTQGYQNTLFKTAELYKLGSV